MKENNNKQPEKKPCYHEYTLRGTEPVFVGQKIVQQECGYAGAAIKNLKNNSDDIEQQKASGEDEAV